MEQMEAMLWVATMRRAQQGDKEAQEMIAQEEQMRQEMKLPTLREELYRLTMSEEDREIYDILQDEKRIIYRRPKN